MQIAKLCLKYLFTTIIQMHCEAFGPCPKGTDNTNNNSLMITEKSSEIT